MGTVTGISERKLAANRANAQKSTGPRTAEGKRASSRNALTHGLFCHDVVLPGEDQEAFDVLRREMLASLKPQHAVELMLVERIVIAQWKLRRLRRVEVRHHADRQRNQLREWSRIDPRGRIKPRPTELSATLGMINDRDYQRRDRYEQRLETSIHRNLTQLRRLRTPIRGYVEPESCPYLDEEVVTSENEATASPPLAASQTQQRGSVWSAKPQAEDAGCENEPNKGDRPHGLETRATGEEVRSVQNEANDVGAVTR